MSEYEPGTIAMLTYGNGEKEIGLCVTAGHGGGDYKGRAKWRTASDELLWSSVTDIRPLAVLDPEDREDAVRALRAFHGIRPESAGSDDVSDAAASLRLLTRPPKPEEPTGLGAVVEDAEGVLWVQFEAVTGYWWRNRGGRNLRWSDIGAVRVLSEGVK